MKKKSKKLNKIQKSYKLRPSHLALSWGRIEKSTNTENSKPKKIYQLSLKKIKKITSDPPQHKIKHR